MLNIGNLITAVGTPLDSDDGLHEEGLKRHLAEQWAAGIDGILVGGTMGMMQMLRDQTYQMLVTKAVEFSRGRGEILVGVGDISWSRTCDRIESVCRYAIDGVVVLTPQWFHFSQAELIDYFTSLAELAPVPLYLYDMGDVPGVALEMATYEALVKHPNIRGTKVSGRLAVARELKHRFGHEFRIILAEPNQIDTLLREGFHEHLDGMFAIAPHWVVAINRAVSVGDWERAAHFQGLLNQLRDLLIESSGIMGAFTAMQNARDIPGRFHAAPYSPLHERDRLALLSSPIMRELTDTKVAVE